MMRTTILLPDDLHERLRQEALRAKTSMAEVIRRRLRRSSGQLRSRVPRYDPLLKVSGICRGPALSADVDKLLYGN